MEDVPARREAARPRRLSELGANVHVSLQDGDVTEEQPARDSHPGPDRAAGGRTEPGGRRNSGPHVVHQRHMPMEPLKFQRIPRKTRESRGGLVLLLSGVLESF